MASNPRYPLSRFFFGLAFLAVLILFFTILKPFLVAIIMALTLVSLFHSNYTRLNSRLGDRKNLSAFLACVILALLIILPLILISGLVYDELNDAYVGFRMQLASGAVAGVPTWDEGSAWAGVWGHVERYLGVSELSVSMAVSTLVDHLGRYLLEHFSSILGRFGELVFNFAVMVFSMFFFFRDGEKFLAEVRRLLPLEPKYEVMVLSKLRKMTRATFLGIFATALLQGVCAALTFFLFGVSNPVLLGTATAFCAPFPIVGAGLVWGPVALLLILSGSIGKGIAVACLGLAIITSVDNFLRPLIIEETSGGMHLLLIFISLLGGMMAFGPAGLVIGPLIAALLVTFLEIYKVEYRSNLF